MPDVLFNNHDEFRKLISSFFVDNKLQKKLLRNYVFKIMTVFDQQLDYCLHNPEFSLIWNQVKDMCFSTNNQVGQISLERIQALHSTIHYWLNESVISPEKFEFFILSKAVDLSSGDNDKDYYYAQLIRHDQLLAACSIFNEALEKIKSCCNLNAIEITESPNFIYFSQKEINQRIFEKAEELYQIRKELKILN